MAKKPDYRLKALDKKTNCKNNNVGAAWKNDDGSISIVLSPCVQLVYDKTMLLTLFPSELEDK